MMIGTSLQSLREFIVLMLTLLLMSLQGSQVLCGASLLMSLARPMKPNDSMWKVLYIECLERLQLSIDAAFLQNSTGACSSRKKIQIHACSRFEHKLSSLAANGVAACQRRFPLLTMYIPSIICEE